MKFEWDESKRQANIRKHGIDFEDAKEAFLGPMQAHLDLRQDYGEERWFSVGAWKGVPLFIVFTEPHDGVVRLISARKADKDERKKFEEEIRKTRR